MHNVVSNTHYMEEMKRLREEKMDYVKYKRKSPKCDHTYYNGCGNV